LELIEHTILQVYYGSLSENQQDIREDDEDLRKRVMTQVLEIKSNVNLLRQIAEINEVHAMILKNNITSQQIPNYQGTTNMRDRNMSFGISSTNGVAGSNTLS
jgi:hypothetical protein